MSQPTAIVYLITGQYWPRCVKLVLSINRSDLSDMVPSFRPGSGEKAMWYIPPGADLISDCG